MKCLTLGIFLSLMAVSDVQAQCRSDYDLTALHLKDFESPVLAQAATGFRSARARSAIAGAKASGYDKTSAYNAAMAQAQVSAEAADKGFEQAKQLIDPSAWDHIGQYKREGLPPDFKCGGAGSSAICAAVIQQWTAEVSKQTAELIQCEW